MIVSPLKLRYEGSVTARSIEQIMTVFDEHQIKFDLSLSSKIHLHHDDFGPTHVDVSFDDTDEQYVTQQLLGYVLRTKDRSLELRVKDEIEEEHIKSFQATVKDQCNNKLDQAYYALERLYRGNNGRD